MQQLAAVAARPGNDAREVVGVVVVDHGSKRAASNEMLVEFAELYRSVSGQDVVEAAHMEIAKPSIADAVSRCIARGATRVVVAPYFLSRGRHIQEDIPALVAEAQQQHPDVPCLVADPIGIDPLVAQIISNRVQGALAEEGEQHSPGVGAAHAAERY